MNFWELSIGGWRPVYALALAYLRNSPFDFGKEFLRHEVAGHSPRFVQFTNKDGIIFDLDMTSFIQRFIYCFHYYEPGDVAVAKGWFHHGATVMDVGANIGQYALLASKMVGDSGDVYAFEPSPEVLMVLHKNCEVNGFDNLHIVPCAVGSSVGEFDFYVGVGDNQGIGSLLPAGEYYAGIRSEDAMSVKVVTLDIFCLENGIDHVDFIKIDAEGFDLEVLKGADKILTENVNIVVMVEIEYKNTEDRLSTEGIWELMKNHGFSAFQSNATSPFKSYVSGQLEPIDSPQNIDGINVFFMREEVGEKMKRH